MEKVIKAQRGGVGKRKQGEDRSGSGVLLGTQLTLNKSYGPNNLSFNSGRHKGDVRWTRRQQFLYAAYTHVLECYGDVKFLNTLNVGIDLTTIQHQTIHKLAPIYEAYFG